MQEWEITLSIRTDRARGVRDPDGWDWPTLLGLDAGLGEDAIVLTASVREIPAPKRTREDSLAYLAAHGSKRAREERARNARVPVCEDCWYVVFPDEYAPYNDYNPESEDCYVCGGLTWANIHARQDEIEAALTIDASADEDDPTEDEIVRNAFLRGARIGSRERPAMIGGIPFIVRE
jgi:hypothetical protein